MVKLKKERLREEKKTHKALRGDEHYMDFIDKNDPNDLLGFSDKVGLPRVETKIFNQKTFFARFYACKAFKKTDGLSKFSEAFVENFDN